jgi:hypothetical protein
MFSGSVRGAAKPITIVALEVYPTIGSAPADLMMSRAFVTPAHQQDGYPTATEPLLIPQGLTEESIPDC